jgi:hypothetical protein
MLTDESFMPEQDNHVLINGHEAEILEPHRPFIATIEVTCTKDELPDVLKKLLAKEEAEYIKPWAPQHPQDAKQVIEGAEAFVDEHMDMILHEKYQKPAYRELRVGAEDLGNGKFKIHLVDNINDRGSHVGGLAPLLKQALKTEETN